METEVEKLRAENAALRTQLQRTQHEVAQLETIHNINFYQAFNEQRAKATGLQVRLDRARQDLGKLQGVYDHDWTNWGITVDRLYEQLTVARAEITSLKSQVQEITEGRQPAAAAVSDQSAVLRL
jgi:chromosome segregation ATPase